MAALRSSCPKQAKRKRPMLLITDRNFANLFVIVCLLTFASGALNPALKIEEVETNGQHAFAAENGLHEAAKQDKGNQGPEFDKPSAFPPQNPSLPIGGEHNRPQFPITSKKNDNDAKKADGLRAENDWLKQGYKKVDLQHLQEKGFAQKFLEVHGLKLVDAEGKDELLAAVAKQRRTLKSSETTLAGFHWYSFRFDKSFSTVLANYKEAILAGMEKDGETFEKWFSELSTMNKQPTTQRVTDLWNRFWESVKMEHKQREGGVYYFLKNLLKMIFQRPKWRRERLNSQFSKIRRRTDMNDERRDRILELERMHQAGVSLTEQERALVKRIAKKGSWGLTEEEFALLPRLDGQVVDSRRVVEVDQLTARLNAWGGGVEEIDLAVRALRTLKEYARQRLEWTAAQQDLVVSLGEIKTLRRLKLLARDSFYQSTIQKLAAADSERVYRSALRSLEVEDGLQEAMSKVSDGLRQKLLNMNVALFNEADDIRKKFTDSEWVRIKQLSDEQEMRQASLHVDLKTPDPADISTDPGLRTPSQRAQAVLQYKLDNAKSAEDVRLPQALKDNPAAESNPEEEKVKEHARLLQALKERPAAKLDPDEEKEVKELADQLVEESARKDDRAKAFDFLEFVEHSFAKDSWGPSLRDQTRSVLQSEAMSPEMSSMARVFAEDYEEFIDFMTAQEKALFRLKMLVKQSENTKNGVGPFTLPRERLMKKLEASGVLQEKDIQEITRLAMLRLVPNVHKRALLRLQARELPLSEKEETLLGKLRMRKHDSLSPDENDYIKNLARESVLIAKSKAPAELQKAAMKMTTKVQLGNLQAQLYLFQNLKLEELVELARLNSLPSTDKEFRDDTKFFKILMILLKAHDRSAVNLSLTSSKDLPLIFNQMKELKASEIRQANLAVNEKEADYLSFIQLLNKRTAETIRLPSNGLDPLISVIADYHKFVKKRGSVEAKTAGPLPPLEPRQDPVHLEQLVEPRGSSASKSEEMMSSRPAADQDKSSTNAAHPESKSGN